MTSNYLRTAAERRSSILQDNNANDRFYFEHQTVGDVAAFRNGVFLHQESGAHLLGGSLVVFPQLNRSAAATVNTYDALIVQAAAEFGIDADIVRAVIYTEVSRGVSYGQVTELVAGLSGGILEVSTLPGNIHPDWEVLIPGSDVNNTSDNIRLTAKLLSEISDRLDVPYVEDIYALFNGMSLDRTYENGETKNTPYFMKRVFEERAWEKNWELTPNGDVEFYTTAKDSKFLMELERQQVLAGNLRPNIRDFASFSSENLRNFAIQQFEAGTINPLLFLNPSFNPNAGSGVWLAISANVAQITQPWDKIVIAYNPSGSGGSFGLAVNYSNGTQETLSTLIVNAMDADETYLYTHNTVSLTGTVNGLNIAISRPDGQVLSSANIIHNADGSINRAKVNNFISEELSISTDIFGSSGNLTLARPEINIVDPGEVNIAQLNSIYGQIGNVIGSTIGGLLTDQIDGTAGVVADVVVSSVFGQIGATFGATLSESGDFIDNFGSNLETAFTSELVPALGSAAVGTISSLLTAEMADALNLDGVAGEVFGVVGSSLLQGVVSQGLETTLNTVFDGVGTTVFGGGTEGQLANLGSALAGYLGNKLGGLVVSPTTQAGVVLSSLGSSVGGLIGASSTALGTALTSIFGITGSAVPIVGTFIGAFLGTVLGTLIGNLFGKKKPKIPTADASTVLSFQDGYYYLGTVNSANSGNEDLVTDMANASADTLNAFIDAVYSGDANARNINTTSPTQIYGHQGNQLYVTLGGTRHNVTGADQAVDKGVLYAIERTEIAGGSLLMKRAVLTSTADNLASFGGDLKIAEDYTTYKLNQLTIDAAIAAPYESLSASDKAFYDSNEANFLAVQRSDHATMTSAQTNWYNANKTRVDAITTSLNSVSQFAAGWIITLQRAAELGLNKSAVSDFYGGAKGFVDSLAGIVSQPISYEDIAFKLAGVDLEVYFDANDDGVAQSTEDMLFDETGFLRAAGHADGGVGYHQASSNATMTAGNDIIIGASGTIDDLTTHTTTTTTPGYMDWSNPYEPEWVPGTTTTTTQTVEGGDDIIIGNSGANTFYGRTGDDWLDGGAGDAVDTLYGNEGNDVLLGRGGNDSLYGGDGDDVIYGGDGDDWILGGNGNDTLIQGAGTSAVNGDAGDDLLILTQGSAGAYIGSYRGGYGAADNGNDTVSFERFNEGIVLDMSYHPGSWDTHSNSFYRDPATRLYDIRSNDGTNQRLNYAYASQIDNITGTSFADVLTGDSSANILRGLGGDDVLHATGGADVLEGGAGADTFHQLSTANSSVTISYEHSLGGVDVSLNYLAALGEAHAFGGDASGDVFVGAFYRLTGSAYADVLEGNHGNNILSGLDGDDYFVGSRGTDTYYGGEGFDTLDFGNHAVTSGLTINAYDGGYTSGYRDGVNGVSGSTRTYGIEHVVGTSGNDTIHFTAGDNVLEGGGGVDYLYGGTGNDIYFVELGGGHDRVYEYANAGHDTIMVGYEETLSWDDVSIGGGNNLAVTVQGQTLATAYNSPNANRELVGVDAIDIGGTGSVDIWYLTGASHSGGGTNGNNILRGYGDHRGLSILQGFDGNDTIYSATTSGSNSLQWEDNANILHGGRGNDTIYASVGDDQYIFDRGSGIDTITDMGGLDHIQFGPGVGANELIFEVYGNDLYIGVTPEGTEDSSALNARQMTDRIRIINGGYGTGQLIEYLTVQNVNIDIRTLDIAWINPYSGGGGGGGGNNGGGLGGGGNYNIPPIMFDLDGDGLDMVSLNESRIVIKGDDSSLTRIGWLGGDDGFLALDRNGDGKINRLTEISFVGDLEGATTDMEGLKAYDSNDDGVFDASDDRFSEFLIWQDINQNGRSSRRELMSLEEAGITSISFTLQTTGNDIGDYADNVVLNTADYTRSDGTTGTTYDVALAASVIQEGRESNDSRVGQSDDELGGQLGRISVRRIERLIGQQQDNDNGTVTPIVIDLNGDGLLDLVHLDDSGIEIDVNNDGLADRMGWVGASDGLLALDRNGDGTITAVSEISFTQDLEGAQTDLEGLAAFDSNGDGYLTASDERFAEFQIWQDLNQDGISQEGELQTLDEAGLTSINLTAHTGQQAFGGYLDNVVFGTTAIQWDDGSEGIAGDVGLRVEYNGVYAEGGVSGPQFLTGFAGLEHVHVDAMQSFSDIATESAWGRIAGHRSPLMARLRAAEDEQARLDAMGIDLGMTQDELLADFDSDDDEDENAAAAVEAEAVNDNTDDATSDVSDDGSEDAGSASEAPATPYAGDDQLPAVRQAHYESLTRQSGMGALALTDVTAVKATSETRLTARQAASLDQFTQAMAGFGASTAFNSLDPLSKDAQETTGLTVHAKWDRPRMAMAHIA